MFEPQSTVINEYFEDDFTIEPCDDGFDDSAEFCEEVLDDPDDLVDGDKDTRDTSSRNLDFEQDMLGAVLGWRGYGVRL